FLFECYARRPAHAKPWAWHPGTGSGGKGQERSASLGAMPTALRGQGNGRGAGRVTAAASQFAPPRVVALAPARRLLAHPAQERRQLRRLPQFLNGRVGAGQRGVGVGGVDHAVTLRADQRHVVLGAAPRARQAVVLGEVLALERPLTQTA